MDPTESPVEAFDPEQLLMLARARRRRAAQGQQTPQEEPSLTSQVGRQLGLTARAGGPIGAGAALGAAMGAPLVGVGAGPGAGMGAAAASILWLADRIAGTNYLDRMMDKFLPKPESELEKVVGAGAESMAGGGAITGMAQGLMHAAPKAGKFLPPFRPAHPAVETLAANPGLEAVASGAGGMASEATAQGGGDPTAQFLASMAASAAAPMSVSAAKATGQAVSRAVGDVGHAVGAALGRKSSVERLARDAVRGVQGADTPEIRQALSEATTHVPGAGPTVAEAVAEANLKTPGRQVGGELLRLQDSLTGARGAADILPSKVKAQGEALQAHADKLRELTAPLRDRAFENARLRGGIDPQSIRWDIAIKEMDPGTRGHPLAMRLLQSVRRHLAKVQGDGGKIDPEVLYSVRQTASKELGRLQESMPYVDKAVGQKALRSVQKSIDLAMERGGATGWRSYLKDFEEGMRPLDAHAKRLEEAVRIGRRVQATGPKALVEETLPQIPTLLHRPTMLVNYVLNKLGKDAVTPVTRELATRMQDPQQFLQLMARPDGTPAKQAMYDVLVNAAILSSLIQKHQAEQQPPAE